MDDVEMWISLLQTVGVPSVVCAASFFYIFKKDLWAQAERREYMLREEEVRSGENQALDTQARTQLKKKKETKKSVSYTF